MDEMACAQQENRILFHCQSACLLCGADTRRAHLACARQIFAAKPFLVKRTKNVCCVQHRHTHTCLNCKIIIMPLIIIVATGANMLPTVWRLNTMWINMDRKMSWTIYLHACRDRSIVWVPPPVGSLRCWHCIQSSFVLSKYGQIARTGCTACATTQVIWCAHCAMGHFVIDSA